MIDIEKCKQFMRNVWLADTAATSHFATSEEGLENVRSTYSEIQMGKGWTKMIARNMGEKRVKKGQRRRKNRGIHIEKCKDRTRTGSESYFNPSNVEKRFSTWQQRTQYIHLKFDKIYKSGNSVVAASNWSQ
jgi:hypothetical protein